MTVAKYTAEKNITERHPIEWFSAEGQSELWHSSEQRLAEWHLVVRHTAEWHSTVWNILEHLVV